MLNKLKNLLLPKFTSGKVNSLTNQELVNKVNTCFSEIIARESFNDRMLFDCSFLILMHPDDYTHAELRLPFITDGIVEGFYKIITQKESKYPVVKPLARYWYFQYCPSVRLTAEQPIEPGNIFIISTATVANDDWSPVTTDNNYKVSLNGKDSKYSKFDFDVSVLSNVDIIKKGKFRIPIVLNINSNPGKITTKPAVPAPLPTVTAHNQELAKIYFMEGKKRMSFQMLSMQIEVGKAKSNDEHSTTKKLSVFTNDRDLQQHHFSIRFDEKSRLFYIAVFAPTRVNEELLTVSSSTESPTWQQLKQKSAILCGTLFQFDFEASK